MLTGWVKGAAESGIQAICGFAGIAVVIALEQFLKVAGSLLIKRVRSPIVDKFLTVTMAESAI
jgi:hypothetical protein